VNVLMQPAGHIWRRIYVRRSRLIAPVEMQRKSLPLSTFNPTNNFCGGAFRTGEGEDVVSLELFGAHQDGIRPAYDAGMGLSVRHLGHDP